MNAQPPPSSQQSCLPSVVQASLQQVPLQQPPLQPPPLPEGQYLPPQVQAQHLQPQMQQMQQQLQLMQQQMQLHQLQSPAPLAAPGSVPAAPTSEALSDIALLAVIPPLKPTVAEVPPLIDLIGVASSGTGSLL